MDLAFQSAGLEGAEALRISAKAAQAVDRLRIMVMEPNYYKDRLDSAMRNPKLFDIRDVACSVPDAEDAALTCAIALGACRHFNVDCGELDGTLQAEVAAAAARALARRVAKRAQQLTTIEQEWDAAVEADTEETEALLLGELEFSLDASHAHEAIVESWLAYADVPELREALNGANRAMMAHADAIESHEALFSAVAFDPMLGQWRELMAPEFADAMPWWLDHGLERVALRVLAL